MYCPAASSARSASSRQITSKTSEGDITINMLQQSQAKLLLPTAYDGTPNFTINTKMFAIQKILREIAFVKITKNISSVDPESGHSYLIFVQYPHDSPRSAWELQKKTNSRKNYKTNYKKKPGGELICKKFGVNGMDWLVNFEHPCSSMISGTCLSWAKRASTAMSSHLMHLCLGPHRSQMSPSQLAARSPTWSG